MLPPRLAAGGMSLDEIYTLFPNLRERSASSGGNLSGGQQQMLAIARILRTGAQLILLDEPTAGLAPVIVQQIGQAIRTLKERGFTIVLVEQNFRFATKVADRHYVMEHGCVVDRLAVHGAVRPAAAWPDQRFFLRLALDRPGGDFRPVEHHQLRPWRAVHGGRVPGLDAVELPGRELLGGACAGAADHGGVCHRDGALADLAHLSHGPSVRAAAHLRHCVADRRRPAPGLWRVGAALHHPQGADRGRQPGLHVPALVPRLGRGGVAGAVPGRVGADREDAGGRDAARGDGKPDDRAFVRHQRAAADHTDLCAGRRAGVGGGRARGAPLPGPPDDGIESGGGRVCGGGDRRHGLHHGRHRQRLWAWHYRRPDQGLLPRGRQPGDLHHHGAGAAVQAGGTVRQASAGAERAGRGSDAATGATEPARDARVDGGAGGGGVDRALVRVSHVPDEGAVLRPPMPPASS
ncbi:hypothetical protein G6F57_014695 [Rhizopus arrhizus]|nr:hypothetical protein G6F57_014695 [Rhizopus arrhizus]